MKVDSVKVFQDAQRDIFASVHKLRTKSENSKTGDMAGLYILPLSDSPTESIKSKTDDRQCGDCPLKRTICYVNPVSTNSPWHKIHSEPVQDLPLTIDKPLRLGVYGDPAFVPRSILRQMVKSAPRHTGYTHQWLNVHKAYSKYLMASIDDLTAKREGVTSVELKQQANDKGYRTFRVVQEASELTSDEILCPYETHNVQCADCSLCDGTYRSKGRKNIAIIIHGPQNKVKTYQKGA